MEISDFDWDEGNVDHIARHGVGPDEVEEVFDESPRIFRGRGGRYVALGRSSVGRYLFVVFEYWGRGEARVVTARPMTQKEKRRIHH